MLTLNMIKGFLLVIIAMIAGFFFLIWVMQRNTDFAILRSIGTNKFFIFAYNLIEIAMLLIFSIIAGIVFSLGVSKFISNGKLPFSLEISSNFLEIIAIFIAGIIGSLYAILKATKVEPYTALGDKR